MSITSLFSCCYCFSGVLVAIGTLVLYKLLKGRPALVKPSRNQAVLVTGCDSGFGRAAALKLHDFGYTVFAGCLNASSVNLPVKESLKVLQMDVTRDDQVTEAFSQVKEWLNEKSGNKFVSLVNNAGINVLGPLEWIPMRLFDRVLQVNLFGVIRVTKQALPLMRNGGRVVAVSSIGGELNAPNASAYCVSKAAVLSLLDCMRSETYHLGVTYSAICPDFFATEITNGQVVYDAFKKYVDEEVVGKEVYDAYWGDRAMERTRKKVTEEIPAQAKTDISPVIDSILDAVASEKPKRTYYPIENSVRVLKFLRWYAPSVLEYILSKQLVPK